MSPPSPIRIGRVALPEIAALSHRVRLGCPAAGASQCQASSSGVCPRTPTRILHHLRCRKVFEAHIGAARIGAVGLTRAGGEPESGLALRIAGPADIF